MAQLALIIACLMQYGVTLRDVTIETVPQSDTVYDCDAFVAEDATILVCVQDRKILIVR